uniref:Uncharacterized protein n=1 Tax=Arion vulgaris TaxID=1028688 RepID=A0A0B7AND2_9EUPU
MMGTVVNIKLATLTYCVPWYSTDVDRTEICGRTKNFNFNWGLNQNHLSRKQVLLP